MTRGVNYVRRAAPTLAACVLALLVLWWLSPTHDVPGALAAFWRGSVGSASALLSGTLVRAIPLAILGTGIAVAFRAGVFNIGGEGQLLMGAVAATAVGLEFASSLGRASVIIALVAAALGGAAWAGIAAALRRRFGVLEVISTIMLNFVAANLVSFLVRGPLQEPTRAYPQTELIGSSARLWRLGDTRLHVGLLLAIVACVSAWWLITKTAAGFRIRAVGASPSAATVIGRVDVADITSKSLMVSGALAGLAGGIEVTGVTYALYENLSPGYGFTAIAVAILARLNPMAVMPTALLFAALETGALGMQRDAGVPSVVAMAIEAIVILVAVVAGSGVPRASRSALSRTPVAT